MPDDKAVTEAKHLADERATTKRYLNVSYCSNLNNAVSQSDKANADSCSPYEPCSLCTAGKATQTLDSMPTLVDNLVSAASDGESALLGAASQGHLEIVQYLLDNNSNITIADSGKRILAQHALENGSRHNVNAIQKLDAKRSHFHNLELIWNQRMQLQHELAEERASNHELQNKLAAALATISSGEQALVQLADIQATTKTALVELQEKFLEEQSARAAAEDARINAEKELNALRIAQIQTSIQAPEGGKLDQESLFLPSSPPPKFDPNDFPAAPIPDVTITTSSIIPLVAFRQPLGSTLQRCREIELDASSDDECQAVIDRPLPATPLLQGSSNSIEETLRQVTLERDQSRLETNEYRVRLLENQKIVDQLRFTYTPFVTQCDSELSGVLRIQSERSGSSTFSQTTVHFEQQLVWLANFVKNNDLASKSTVHIDNLRDRIVAALDGLPLLPDTQGLQDCYEQILIVHARIAAFREPQLSLKLVEGDETTQSNLDNVLKMRDEKALGYLSVAEKWLTYRQNIVERHGGSANVLNQYSNLEKCAVQLRGALLLEEKQKRQKLYKQESNSQIPKLFDVIYSEELSQLQHAHIVLSQQTKILADSRRDLQTAFDLCSSKCRRVIASLVSLLCYLSHNIQPHVAPQVCPCCSGKALTFTEPGGLFNKLSLETDLAASLLQLQDAIDGLIGIEKQRTANAALAQQHSRTQIRTLTNLIQECRRRSRRFCPGSESLWSNRLSGTLPLWKSVLLASGHRTNDFVAQIRNRHEDYVQRRESLNEFAVKQSFVLRRLALQAEEHEHGFSKASEAERMGLDAQIQAIKEQLHIFACDINDLDEAYFQRLSHTVVQCCQVAPEVLLPGWYSGNNSRQDPPSWLKVLQSHAEFKGLDRPALDVNVFEHMKQISGPPLSRHVVYRARYRGKPVALKHYSLEGPHEYTNLLREAETLQRLAACPYIADVEFVFQVFGKLEAYLVMPFYTGGTLDALQFDQGFNSQVMAHVVCRQLAEAVSCVHRHGKIHCDIKPANVMLMGGPGTHIRLGDFDVSKDSTRRLDDAVSRARNIATNSTVGTLNFMAPELLPPRSERPTQASDIFSLGCIFYDMIFPENRTRPLCLNPGEEISVPMHANETLRELIIAMIRNDSHMRPTAQQVVEIFSTIIPPQPPPETKTVLTSQLHTVVLAESKVSLLRAEIELMRAALHDLTKITVAENVRQTGLLMDLHARASSLSSTNSDGESESISNDEETTVS